MARGDVLLLERQRELDVIAEQLRRCCAGVGGLLVVEGAAGIGKTRLVTAARRCAEQLPMTVLSARASELERGLPFGVVRSLFEARVTGAPREEQDLLLAGAAAMAAPVLGLPSAPAVPFPDGTAFAGLHGLYWLTANLSEHRPLLLAVDDAHWADTASLRFLAYLLPRLPDLPVLVVVAARAGEPGADERLLDVLRDDPLSRVLVPAALTEQATATVVRSGFSPEADPALCRACHVATAGNPLLITMLAHALRDEGADPTATGQLRAQELALQVAALSVLPRLRRLPTDAAALARAVAVLGDGAQVRHAAAVAALPTGPATRAADALATAGILGPGRPLEFVHPTIRAAVHHSLPPAELHRAHRLAAQLLADEGAPSDRVAAHLLLVERLGNGWVVDVLRAAARQALSRGSVEEAVRCLERALDEPPAPPVRADVLLELGVAAALIRGAAAADHLRQALALTTEVRGRAEISLELAKVLSAARDTRGALDVLERAVGEVGEVDQALRVRLEAEHISVARRDPATRARAGHRLQALAAHGRPDSLAGCVLLANLATAALERDGAADEATRLACDALHADRLLGAGESDVALMATAVLMTTDQLGPAWTAWNGEVDRARRCGSILRFTTAVTVRACLAYRCGRLADAEADGRLADDVHREHGLDLLRRFSLAFLVGALVERGEVDAATELLDGATVPMNLAVLLDSRARLRCAQGRHEEAVEDFLTCGARLIGRGTSHPGVVGWRSAAALALHQLDRTRDARALADEELDLARRLDVPRALGIALRAAGLVRGGTEGVVLLEEAVSLLARSSARLEHARALTDLGAALRRDNRRSQARAPLEQALDLAAACGATPLAVRARSELLAAGARPRRARAGVDALTPSERRVAQMAADGLGNRAIAQALFVTVKTVEVHLASTYRKLGVPSRAALPAVLAAGQQPDG